MNDTPSPLSPEQWQTLVSLLGALTPAQRQWVSGFVAGFAALDGPRPEPAKPASAPAITLLHGSQTGNAERLARAFHERLVQAGHEVRLESMAGYPFARIKRESSVLIVVSTHGEGEPPDNARAFHDFLHSPHAMQKPLGPSPLPLDRSFGPSSAVCKRCLQSRQDLERNY